MRIRDFKFPNSPLLLCPVPQVHTFQTLISTIPGRGQRERPAAPGGAAEAGGWRGEDQGLPGSCRASAVLHTECMQGRPAARCSGWKQPLPGAQVLCSTLKTGKKLAEEALCAHGDG